MDYFRTVNVNIFSLIYLLIICVSLFARRQQYSLLNRFFINIILSTIIILALEAASWYFEGKPGKTARQLNYLLNFSFFLLNFLPVITWLCYIDYKIFASLERIRKRLFYLPVLLPVTIFMIASIKFDFIFGIDGTNNYFRGPGSIIHTVLIFLLLFSSLPMVIKNRKYIDRNVFFAFYSFLIFPIIGAVLQLIFPGTLIVWNTVALAVLTTFMFLEIQYLSKDFLTGLFNRRQIDEWINRRIKMANRGKPNFSLIMIDLDDFKMINDSFGHPEGDQALIIFANILNQSVKQSDIISRFAGDEFLIALETTYSDSVDLILSRIADNVEYFNMKKIKPYQLKFSAGYATFDPARHRSYLELLQAADTEMYKNKSIGKESVRKESAKE